MTQEKIKSIVEEQRNFFKTNKTLDMSFRIEALKKLKSMVINNEKEMEEALAQDLGRHFVEAYFCDIGSIILEINETISGLKKWGRPETHFSGLACFPSLITKVYKMPYGTTLIISPFNFPFLLSIGVLIPAIAGGNTAVIKASSKSKSCTSLLKKMISETFPAEYITVVDGGHDVADYCLEERFDKIFYTGSPKVAVHVMEMAAKNLTPVALELGGENGNWCIVRKDADIKDAARKIAFFKALNSGQICININQVAVASEIAEDFIEELKKAFDRSLSDNSINNPEYPKLITAEAYDKCVAEAEEYRDRIRYGGKGDRDSRKFEPTIIFPVDIKERIANHELFNPLLPIIPFKDNEIDKVIEEISNREHGLALYVFTNNKRWAKHIFQTMQYGGGCLNEVCIHLMVKGVPFNGVGHSGMGAYHGHWGFSEFTHPSTVLYGKTKFNLSLREHPYEEQSGIKMKMLKLFER
ncbi:aldehyde dehydrogenase (NAD+) [Pseudobutyrivibrio sp. YE44]|uniref:aldehyde dehydrogenase family protein n=1 Tax=Pseudobutyrivibrio sp. YE44 TaxID=1520802 RepID=UPI0008895639|nr:aldehyde dehydrogenase family protein [Pseudobutyrivibrio sp. YE44]SDB55519.1 aldehyde dehydrogenase (NAD+) [Pseudobutyrivibrio sp. YE44]